MISFTLGVFMLGRVRDHLVLSCVSTFHNSFYKGCSNSHGSHHLLSFVFLIMAIFTGMNLVCISLLIVLNIFLIPVALTEMAIQECLPPTLIG